MGKKEIADYADYLKKQGPITPVMPEKAAPVKEKTLTQWLAAPASNVTCHPSVRFLPSADCGG